MSHHIILLNFLDLNILEDFFEEINILKKRADQDLNCLPCRFMLSNLVSCKSDLNRLAEIVSDSNFYLLVGETSSVKQVSTNVASAKFGPRMWLL